MWVTREESEQLINMQERYISDWVLVLEDLNKDRKIPRRKIAGKNRGRTNVSKQVNESEYGNFLNTSGIMTSLLV